MASYPTDLKYTKEHEWIRIEGNVGAVGITDFAQQQLGDVVYVEVPEPGATLTAGQVFGTIESVKAVSELFAPGQRRGARGERGAEGHARSRQQQAARHVDGEGQAGQPRRTRGA